MAAYGTDQGFTDWLAANGFVLPADAPSPEILRTIGSAYMDSAYEWRLYCSRRTDPLTQELAWPRTGAVHSGVSVPDDMIPQAWITASYRAAWLQASQGNFATGGSDPSRVVKKQKAGQVEREFFGADESGRVGNAKAGFNVDPLIDGMVATWLCDEASDSGVFLMSVGS